MDFRPSLNPPGGTGPRRWPGPGPGSWLPWLPGLLALGLGLAGSGCDHRPTPPAAGARASVAPAPAPIRMPDTGAAPAGLVGRITELEHALAGTAPVSRTFVFERIQFAAGSSAVPPAAAPELAYVARVLKQAGSVRARVQVTTHANVHGDLDAALALDQARAEAIKTALVAQGVAGERIDAFPGSISSLSGAGTTPADLVENRRAELTVTRD